MNVVSSLKYHRTSTFPHKRSMSKFLLSVSGSSAPLPTFVLWNHQYVALEFLFDKYREDNQRSNSVASDE